MDTLTITAYASALAGFALAGWLLVIAYDVGTSYRRFDRVAARHDARTERRARRSDAVDARARLTDAT